MTPRGPSAPLALALGALLLFSACATTGGGRSRADDQPMLSGLVLDPEGRAIPFAKISVLPQAAYDAPDARPNRKTTPQEVPPGARGLAVTTEAGRWLVDHITADDGADLGLPPSWYYEVTVYKPGFHIWKDSVLYEQGTLQVDVTLYPDTIDLEDIGNVVDTSLGDTNTGTGVLRQGE